MSNLTNTFEANIINVFFRGGSHTGGQLWVGLYTSTLSDSGAGTEASGGWYARVTTGATPTSAWNDPVGNGITANTNQLTWNAVTGSSVSINGVAILNASTGGTMFMWKTLGAPVLYNVGDIPIILAGGLQVEWD